MTGFAAAYRCRDVPREFETCSGDASRKPRIKPPDEKCSPRPSNTITLRGGLRPGFKTPAGVRRAGPSRSYSSAVAPRRCPSRSRRHRFSTRNPSSLTSLGSTDISVEVMAVVFLLKRQGPVWALCFWHILIDRRACGEKLANGDFGSSSTKTYWRGTLKVGQTGCAKYWSKSSGRRALRRLMMRQPIRPSARREGRPRPRRETAGEGGSSRSRRATRFQPPVMIMSSTRGDVGVAILVRVSVLPVKYQPLRRNFSLHRAGSSNFEGLVT